MPEHGADEGTTSCARVIREDGLDAVLVALRGDGFRLLGPTARDGAIVYDDISGIQDLPRGWGDEHDGGHYRLVRRDDRALFGYVVGPTSWKAFLHAPELELWRAERRDGGFEIKAPPEPAARLALIGARSCEVRAIAIQDRVLLGGAHLDPAYAARRRDLFIVAVNCGHPGGTCFCASMATGPRCQDGFDLALTELEPARDHRFLVEVGSARGEELLARIESEPAPASDRDAAAAAGEAATAAMARALPDGDVPELLRSNPGHPRWDEVAGRCLTCGNCTQVCPTCFCTDVIDATTLDRRVATRTRHWASCFTLDFAYVHGGSVRQSGAARYRQWLTHKLGTWYDQFGESGCVGCGRCITWCPVGIDITEEVQAIAMSPGG